MTDPYDRLAKIFSDAEGLGYLDPKYAEVMHNQVVELQIDMMLQHAADQHEVEELKAQREATRRYLGVAISENEDQDGESHSPEDVLRREVKRILDLVPADKKIQRIKELRSSEIAGKAWQDMGNGTTQHVGFVSGNTYFGLGLKEAKDIIDEAYRGFLYCGLNKAMVKL